MFALRGFMARHSIATIVVVLSVAAAVLSLPTIGMFYGLHEWTAAHTGDYYHASCSCRMGPSAESGAVVDARGRVHGYDGLRVCDASVFPDLPRANTYLPTLMVAEHISRFVRSAS